MVRKTAGWRYDPEKDKQIQEYTIIGYAATRAEALQMLAEFNQNPFDIKAAKITFLNVVIITVLFKTADFIRRRIMVDKPVKLIVVVIK